jgi:predicted DNA-binding WGR domain protein
MAYYDYDSGDFSGGSEQSSSSSSQQSSSGYTGLPDWFKNIQGPNNIGNVWDRVNQGGDWSYKQFQKGGNVSPAAQALIEQQRQLMPEQYAQQMALSNARQVQQPLNRMSSRGILNSSVTGDALAKVLREQSARQADQYTQANTWAGNELLKNLGTSQGQYLDTWKTIMNFLPQLLAAIRESQSQSQGSSNSESSGSSWGAPVFPGME